MIVLPKAALAVEIKAGRFVVNALKGVGLNLAMLPGEELHLL